jgi:hypothetical protein
MTKEDVIYVLSMLLIFTTLIIGIMFLAGRDIRKEEQKHKEILEYRTEHDINYVTSSLKDNTEEWFWITVYGLDDTESEAYIELRRSFTEINILETPVGELMNMIDIFELKKYEDYRIKLTSNGKGWEIEK